MCVHGCSTCQVNICTLSRSSLISWNMHTCINIISLHKHMKDRQNRVEGGRRGIWWWWWLWEVIHTWQFPFCRHIWMALIAIWCLCPGCRSPCTTQAVWCCLAWLHRHMQALSVSYGKKGREKVQHTVHKDHLCDVIRIMASYNVVYTERSSTMV